MDREQEIVTYYGHGTINSDILWTRKINGDLLWKRNNKW